MKVCTTASRLRRQEPGDQAPREKDTQEDAPLAVRGGIFGQIRLVGSESSELRAGLTRNFVTWSTGKKIPSENRTKWHGEKTGKV